MKIYIGMLGQVFKGFAYFIVFYFGFMSPASGQEMRIFDQTVTAYEAEHGFHFFTVDSCCSSNWLEPFNYYQGVIHLRYEIIDYPSTEPFILNTCIWSDKESNGTWSEACSGHFPIPGRVYLRPKLFLQRGGSSGRKSLLISHASRIFKGLALFSGMPMAKI